MKTFLKLWKLESNLTSLPLMLGAPHVGLVFGFLGDFFVFGLVFVLANIKKDQGKLIWPPL